MAAVDYIFVTIFKDFIFHKLSNISLENFADMANQEPVQPQAAEPDHAPTTEGGVSPSSSAEELMQINTDPSDKEVGGADQTDSNAPSNAPATHQIVKPEPTKSSVPKPASYQAPPTSGKQPPHQQAPLTNYHPSLQQQGAEQQQGDRL